MGNRAIITTKENYNYTETARRAASDADPTDPTDGDSAEALRQRIVELEAKLDAVKTTDAKIIENSKAAFESLNNRYTGLVADHRKEVTKLKKQIAALKAERDAQAQVAESHAKHYDNLNALYQEMTEEYRAKLKEAEAKYNRLRADLLQGIEPNDEAEEVPETPDPLADIPAVFHPIAAAALAIDGIELTVKGAKTEKPILWISGDTYENREALKALGLKYSNKRRAWYIAAADVKAIAVAA